MTSLTGKNNNYTNNLLGYDNTKNNNKSVSSELKKLKTQLLNNYLIPIFSKQWDVLSQNLFFIEKIKKKIEFYYKIYKMEDFVLYLDLIDLLEMIVEKHKLLEDMEAKITGTSKKDIISLVFKTTAIKLLPEYELYDHILGKPEKDKKEKYDENIINLIQCLLETKDINYNKIKLAVESNRGLQETST
jgi:hypothetical protein